MSQPSYHKNKTENTLEKTELSQRISQSQTIALDKTSIESYLDPPRDLAGKHYSLAPDMIGGWKPKVNNNSKTQMIIPITYEDEKRDLLLKCMIRQRKQLYERLVYLGPLKINSFELHEGRSYQNPHKKDKNFSYLQGSFDKDKVFRNKVLKSPVFSNCPLKFNSDLQGGNLDIAIQRASLQFDLYMRVDSNTRGHTNWYFFQVCNNDYQGPVHFNICNFRRQASLYQKGFKPYVMSQSDGGQWRQEGRNVSYLKSKSKYSFLSAQEEQQIFSKYFVLSFDYQFKYPNDKVKFSYCIPYLYSQLIDFVSNLKDVQRLPSLKTLSGLNIPVLKIGEEDNYQSKKVALITARVHPGQSNSSYVMQGFLNNLCNKTTALSTQLKQKYIFYIIPMVNPDGVVSGNYRTSLFGKDLNRTYNQSRKYAFPQTYYILQLALKLKSQYKNRFNLFIDLHGHSSKKNVFTYGPEFNIQTTNYEMCRQLPKIMSNLTNHFRYYSCSFKISNQKESTARGIFNKVLNIPFTYTLETSNGLFFDSDTQTQTYGNKNVWREIGFFLCKALNTLKLDKIKLLKRILTQKMPEKFKTQGDQKSNVQEEKQTLGQDSDYDPIEEDLPEQMLIELQNSIIQQKSQREKYTKNQDLFSKFKTSGIQQAKNFQKSIENKTNGDETKNLHDFSKQLNRNQEAKRIKQFILPPVIQLNKHQIFVPRKISRQQLIRRQSKNTKQTNPFQKKMCPTIIVHQGAQTQPNKVSRSRSVAKSSNEVMAFLEKFKTIK